MAFSFKFIASFCISNTLNFKFSGFPIILFEEKYMFHFYLEKARNCEGPDRSPQYGATDLGLEYLPRATNSFLYLQYDLSTVRCQIKVHNVNFKAKNNAYFQHL